MAQVGLAAVSTMMAHPSGLGKLDDRRVFLSPIYLADIGILKVDGDTSLGWIDLSIAVEDLLSVVPQARKNYPLRLSYDLSD